MRANKCFRTSLNCSVGISKKTAVISFATTRTWPSFVLQCLGICVTLLMLEQAKRGTPETSECTYQKELEKVTSYLFCLSIVFLVVQSECCHFREHEHSPTTWDIRSINGFFLLYLMSSTFNKRLLQISFNMPTDKVNNLFAFIKLQMLRERERMG